MSRVLYGLMEKVLAKLDALIEDRGLNPSRVATMTGVPQSSLSEMLKGNRKLTFDVMRRVAKALGVSLDYLADDALDSPPRPLNEAQRWAVDFIGDKGWTRKDVVDRLTQDIGPAIRAISREDKGREGRR